MIVGGFTCVNERIVSCNNVDLKNYDKEEPDTLLTFVDFNSLYAEQLREPLPYKDFKFLKPKEVALFDN